MILIPSGKRLHNYGKLPFLMGKSNMSMAIFNSFLYVYQRVSEFHNATDNNGISDLMGGNGKGTWRK